MKIKLLCYLIWSTIPILCFGQYWAPKGAIWHYEQIDMFPPEYNDLIVFESIGDTIIHGDTARVLRETFTIINPYLGDTTIKSNNIYTKFDSNRVFYFHPPANEFRLLYDFNAKEDDTIQVFCRYADTMITIIVDYVYYKDINGVKLKTQYVSQPDRQDCNMRGTIIERIGWMGFMFPQYSWVDPPYGGPLRCYEDSIIGFQPNTTVPCDYITSIQEIKNENQGMTIHPNPTTGMIFIQSDEGFQEIHLYDLLGKHIRQYKNELKIDIHDLKNGIYFMVFIKNDQTIIKKFIKTSH
jgi:Secretion system C-terminal sorting domain